MSIDSLIARHRAWSPARMAIATVIRTWGSAPFPAGSHLLAHEDGRFEGSVSGGCVEGEVLAAAAQVIADGKVQRLRYGVADEAAWVAGLPCGGDIEVLVQPVGEGGFPPELFERIATAHAAGESLAVTTDLATGESRIDERIGEAIFINRYAPPRRLLIIGAVQIAQALARIAPDIGVRPTVIDPRARFLTEERFPSVDRDDRWPDEAIAALAPDPATAIVTLSHDTKIDDPALIAALASPAGYIGALGSQRSHAARLDRLQAAGLSEAALARIDAPVGLAIGAIGPAEIALSIAAGVVAAFRAKG